MRFSGIFNF